MDSECTIHEAIKLAMQNLTCVYGKRAVYVQHNQDDIVVMCSRVGRQKELGGRAWGAVR